MKNMVLLGALCVCSYMLPAVQIPKPSLEHVKNKIEQQLADARKEKDTAAIAKYEAELSKINKKIKKFELEWLEFEKSRLMAKYGDAAAADIQEMDHLIAARK